MPEHNCGNPACDLSEEEHRQYLCALIEYLGSCLGVPLTVDFADLLQCERQLDTLNHFVDVLVFGVITDPASRATMRDAKAATRKDLKEPWEDFGEIIAHHHPAVLYDGETPDIVYFLDQMHGVYGTVKQKPKSKLRVTKREINEIAKAIEGLAIKD